MSRTESTRHFPIIVEQDAEGFFVATNAAIPGCYSQGASMDEALANVREATEACLAERADINNADVGDISVHLITL